MTAPAIAAESSSESSVPMRDGSTVDGHGPPAAAPGHSMLRPARMVAEAALVIGIFLGYRLVRTLTRDSGDHAMRNARRLVDLERGLHLFVERAVQRFVLPHEPIRAFLDHYYAYVHLPLTAAFMVWLLVRHRTTYVFVRTWMIVVTLAALVVHVAFPLAPPRMLHDLGFVDTLAIHGPRIYSSDTTASVANQFAAMPSLHFGWAVIVAAGIGMALRSRYRWCAVLHPVITLVAIVATANHYLMDAIVALVIVLLGARVAATGRAAGSRDGMATRPAMR